MTHVRLSAANLLCFVDRNSTYTAHACCESSFGKQVHTRGLQVTHGPDIFYLVMASGVLVDHILSITYPKQLQSIS